MRGALHGSVRPDLIVCDDLEGNEKIGSRKTVTVVVGTILHYDSLLAQLLKRPGWIGHKWQAIQQWSASPLWEQWEAVYTSRREDLFAYHKKYRFTLAGIEEIQFQELFKDWVIKESGKRGLYLPVEGIRPNSDKVLRISKMQPHIKNGTIRFRRNQTQLIDQLKYFPKADHDDGPDALEMVFTLITHHNTFGPRIRNLSV